MSCALATDVNKVSDRDVMAHYQPNFELFKGVSLADSDSD